jgi:NTP pyrophosphatase (non-canonical NTP hydrolase)
VHALARDKGWWDGENPTSAQAIGAKLALVHSEVSEALECVRSRASDGVSLENGKPEGLPIELADAIIRILDLCGALGIDIESAVETKHEFNAARPFRHGGKAL